MVKKMPDISELRKRCTIQGCEVKYYQDLDFIDIFDRIDAITRKKNTAFSNVDENAYSIGYFKDKFLIRLDTIGDSIVPSETYLIWKEGRLIEAHNYYTGTRFGKQISEKQILNNSWYYTYTNDKLTELVWHRHEDKIFYYCDAITVNYTYEYDREGLLFINKTIQGAGWDTQETYVEYDREKERFLKSCTVSKTTFLSSAAKQNDGTVDFDNRKGYKTKKCPVCGHDMTYLMTVDLEAKKLYKKSSPLTKFPVLHCFECGSEQRYRLNELNIAVFHEPFIKDTAFRFKKNVNADEDETADAFLTIGGMPNWIQEDSHPTCEICGKPMVYVMEIKSREEKSNGKHPLMFGDNGSLYVFVCCGNIVTLPQWY